MSDRASVGRILRKVIGWLLIVIASLAAASQVASLVTRMRPLQNGVGYLIFSAGVLTLGGYLVRKPLKGWRHVLAAIILIVVGVIVVQTSFVSVLGRGTQSTPEQTFDSMVDVAKDIESGKRPDSALDNYFYRSPNEKEGYGDVERIKMRALNEVILRMISSYSFGDRASLDASTVRLAVHYSYSRKAPLTGVAESGTNEAVFVFVKDGRGWKMDCGPRLTVGR